MLDNEVICAKHVVSNLEIYNFKIGKNLRENKMAFLSRRWNKISKSFNTDCWLCLRICSKVGGGHIENML